MYFYSYLLITQAYTTLTNYYFNEFVYVSTFIIILVYLFLLFSFFLLLNNFDTRYIRNLSDLKKFGILFPFNLLFLITIFSFAGIPPLFGFSIKLLIFVVLLNSGSVFYLILLSLFNFFTLYFYIQNVRYLVNNSSNNYYLYANYFVVLSDVNMFVSMLVLLLNIVGVLYLSDILIFFNIFTVT